MTEALHCPACGTAVSEGAKFCTKCGRSVGARPVRSYQPQAQGFVPSAPTEGGGIKWVWIVLAVGVLFALATIAAARSGSGSGSGSGSVNSSSDSSTSSQKGSPELNLAIIQKGDASADDDLTKQFGHELDVLQQHCTDTRTILSDMAYTTNKNLADKGVKESLMTTTTNVAALASSFSPGPCGGAFSLYQKTKLNSP